MAKKSTSKNSSAKKAAKKGVKKRARKSQPLYATITLGKLKALLGNKDSAEVVVSRNFVLDEKKKQMEGEAEKSLGIS